MEKSNHVDNLKSEGEPASETVGPLALDPKDMYLLLQGSAYIKPGPNGTIEVRFVDEAEIFQADLVPTRQPLTFTGELKVLSLHILVECDRQTFNNSKNAGQLGNYFPTVYNEVKETNINMPAMTPIGPPFTMANPQPLITPTVIKP